MNHPTKSDCDLLRAAYAAFNARDIDAALALMTADVTWPMAFKGGYVRGHDEVRAYWSAQWAEIDPRVEPVAFFVQADGSIVADVHQVLCSLDGALLMEGNVGHRFVIEHGLIRGMDVIEAPANPAAVIA